MTKKQIKNYINTTRIGKYYNHTITIDDVRYESDGHNKCTFVRDNKTRKYKRIDNIYTKDDLVSLIYQDISFEDLDDL